MSFNSNVENQNYNVFVATKNYNKLNSILSPSPQILSVVTIDYNLSTTINFNDLISSQTLNIINVPSGSPSISLPIDSELQNLFVNPLVGTLLQYTFETNRYPLTLNSQNSSTIINSTITNLYLQVTSLSPFRISLQQAGISTSSTSTFACFTDSNYYTYTASPGIPVLVVFSQGEITVGFNTHSSSLHSGTDYITVPTTGYYLVTASIAMSASPTGALDTAPFINISHSDGSPAVTGVQGIQFNIPNDEGSPQTFTNGIISGAISLVVSVFSDLTLALTFNSNQPTQTITVGTATMTIVKIA
jgi:hypothetical protein